MNEYKETINQLHKLQSVQASSKLSQRINGLTFALPLQTHNTYFQAFAFKTAIALGVLLLFVGMGSGIVDGAKNSKPGSPLYPVRQALENVQTHLPFVATIEKNVITPTPTALPTKAISPAQTSVQMQKHDDLSDKQEKHEDHQVITPIQHVEKDVKGIQDSIQQFVPFWHNNKSENDTHEDNSENTRQNNQNKGFFFFHNK